MLRSFGPERIFTGSVADLHVAPALSRILGTIAVMVTLSTWNDYVGRSSSSPTTPARR
jgi:hypothetical protein